MSQLLPSVDPKVLGKLLLVQTTLQTLSGPDRIASFLCRGLELMPGTSGTAVRIGNSVVFSDDGFRDELQSEQLSDLCIPPSNAQNSKSTFLGEESCSFCVNIKTMHESYGTILFKCTDPATLASYQPFLENLANTVALSLENRRHEEELKGLNQALENSKIELEEQVMERTRDLLAANQSLLESESKYRDLFEHANDSIFILDTEQNYLDANEKATEIFGFTKEEFLQMNVFDVIPAEQYFRSQKEFKELRSYGKYEKFVGKQRTKDGYYLDVEVSSSSIMKDDKVIGSLDVVRDITERNRMEEKLRQAQKMESIGTLAGGIAHDFNNILSAIIGYTDLAQTMVSGETQLSEYLNEVLKAGNRAKELVTQILTFSRQSEREMKPLRMHLLVREALKMLRSTIPSTIEFRENIDPHAGTVLADPANIHQMLMNLCTNAYQAMREKGGVMVVKLEKVDIEEIDEAVVGLNLKAGAYIRLIVGDNGVGIDRLQLDKIFEPYYTTKQKGEGTGLGLALVHGIVQSHGGHISVYSDLGKGTTFHVYLPRVAVETSGAEDVDDLHPIPRGNERILIVDDEEAIARVEQRLLESLGYRVTCHTGSMETLTLFKRQPDKYDLIITDMTMPNMTGAELAQQIRDIRPDTPIVLCTGFSELMNKRKAAALGITRFLMKPVTRRELALVVREALDT